MNPFGSRMLNSRPPCSGSWSGLTNSTSPAPSCRDFIELVEIAHAIGDEQQAHALAICPFTDVERELGLPSVTMPQKTACPRSDTAPTSVKPIDVYQSSVDATSRVPTTRVAAEWIERGHRRRYARPRARLRSGSRAPAREQALGRCPIIAQLRELERRLTVAGRCASRSAPSSMSRSRMSGRPRVMAKCSGV